MKFGQQNIVTTDAACQIDNIPMFISPEGLIYSFATHNSYPLFVRDKESWIKGINGDLIRELERFRMKRDVNDTIELELEFPDFVAPQLPCFIDKKAKLKTRKTTHK